TENLELKLKIVRQVDALAKPGALLASNTSSISITTLAAVTARPDAFLGVRGRDRASGRVSRRAFLQPGAFDGAGGAGARFADVGCDRRDRRRVRETAGQNAPRGQETRGVSRTPHSCAR